MSNLKEHKHASVLRAIADGVPMSEFELKCIAEDESFGRPLQGWNFDDVVRHPNAWEIRRKLQYIIVNGFKVPKPLDVMPTDGCVYVPDIYLEDFYEIVGVGSIIASV